MDRAKLSRIVWLTMLWIVALTIWSQSPDRITSNIEDLFRQLEGIPESDSDAIFGQAMQTAEYCRQVNRPELAIRALEEGLSRLDSGNEHLRARLLHQAGLFCSETGHLRKGIEFLEMAAGYYRRLDVHESLLQVYLKLGALYKQTGQWQDARVFLDEGLALYSSLNDKEGVALCHTLLGNVAWKEGVYDKALSQYHLALEIRQSLGRHSLIGASLNNIGLIYHELEDSHEAISHYRKALDHFRLSGDSLNVMITLNHIGNVYYKDKAWDAALEKYGQVLAYRRVEKDPAGEASALNNLGLALLGKGDLDEALARHRQALEIRKKLKRPQEIAISLANIGTVWRMKKRYDTALKFYRQSIAIRDTIGDRLGALETRVKIGRVYRENEQWDKAIRTLEAIQVSVDSVSARNLQRLVERLLSETHSEYAHHLSQRGSYHQAWRHASKALDRLMEFKRLEDSHIGLEVRNKISVLNYQMIRDQKQREIERLQYENRLRSRERENQERLDRNRLWFIGGAGVLALLIILLLYSRYRLQRSANRRLQQANEKLLEVNDRIKGLNMELDDKQKQLQALVRRDPLTGISNRRDMLEKLEQRRNQYERYQRSFVVSMADIDHFKRFNDEYGHECGDYVLVAIATLMSDMIRKDDEIARWGGEEFLLLLPETGLEGGRVITERIREKIAATKFRFKEQELRITVTFGVAVYHDSLTVDECINQADKALYMGKREGRNRVVVATNPDSGTQ